jgi:4-hydroxymandelate oxidase
VAARLTLTDVEALAMERLDPDWREYFVGGAGDERTLRANRDAWGSYTLRPRVLSGIGDTSTATTVAGQVLPSPLVVAPLAYMRRAHADGEEGMARAALRARAGMCLSSFATASAAEVAGTAPGLTRWFQVYTLLDHAVTDELVAEALEAGFTAIVLTADLPVVGSRDREHRIEWTMPEDDVPTVVRARLRGSDRHGLAVLDPALDWAYVEHLRSRYAVPILVKGVLTAEDAVLAAEHGAHGVVVSNHGGRQLDLAPATADVLPEIVAAVGDRIDVLVDGGIRRGSDVLVALALGARAVLAGRTPLWGLAAGGEDGAAEVLRLLVEEVAVGLHLLGCRTPADLGEHHVRRTA